MQPLPDESCGQYLKNARTARGYSLHDIERVIKVPVRYLSGIERDDLTVLPAIVYVKGFIRSYAQALGLNQDMVLKLFERSCPQVSEPPHRQAPQGLPLDIDRSKLIGAGIVFVAIIIVLVFITIAVHKAWPQKIIHYFSAISARHTQKIVAAPVITPEPAQLPTISLNPTVQSPAPTKLLSAVKPIPTPTPTKKIPLPSNKAGIEMRLTASQRVWIQVQVDSNPAFAGFVDKDTNRTWKANKKVSLRMGNPAVLRVWINGAEQNMSDLKSLQREWVAK